MTAYINKYPFLVSGYIALFTSFYLWTTQYNNIEKFDDVRYLVTAFFTVPFFLLLRSKLNIKPLGPLVLFIFYCSLIMAFSAEYSHSALYIIWLVYAIIVLPRLISLNFIKYSRFLFYFLLLIVVAAFINAWYFDLNQFFGAEHRLRYTGGFSNPGIYSKLIATSLWFGVLMYVISRKRTYLALIPFFIALLFFADLRTDLYGSIIGLTLFCVFNSRHTSLYLIIFSLFGIVFIIWLLLNYTMHDIDIVTSGRIHVWTGLYQASGFSDDLKVIFFGTGKFIGHYDNQWLKTLLMFGVVGFVLYIFSIYYLLLKLNTARRRESDLMFKGLFSWGMAIMVMFALMGVTTYIFPSLGNTYNLFLIPMLVSVLYLSENNNPEIDV